MSNPTKRQAPPLEILDTRPMAEPPDSADGYSAVRAGDEVEMLKAGTMTLPLGGETARSHMAAVLDGARALGVEVPERYGFGAGQVFFKDGRPEEVRLRLVAIIGEGASQRAEEWTTPTAPQLDYRAGRFLWNPDDAGRCHLSAIVIARPDDGTSAPKLAVLFDLRDDGAPSRSTPRPSLPRQLSQPTFIEARSIAQAISDGHDKRNWREIEGIAALLHAPAKAAHQTRFEPNPLLLGWWGRPNAGLKGLWDELQSLDFDAVISFYVLLGYVLDSPKARVTFTLDELIRLIGRDADARRGVQARREWREKVYRWLLFFDSLTITGARPGTWKEPRDGAGKRLAIPAERLYSNDVLLKIIGTRGTEQPALDGSALPKEVTIVPGEWAMQWHGNREFLSRFGDVLSIAAIPRGKPAGLWAACVGLMLQQLWREQATRAAVGRAGDGNRPTMQFSPFTRRQLLDKTLRTPYDVRAVLDDPKSGHRARQYWKAAMELLQNEGIVGHYKELPAPAHADWREAWLDQPLDIRPKAERMAAALEISTSAKAARKRGRPIKKRTPEPTE